MKSLYEQLGGTYHEGEDGLLYPDLLPPEEVHQPTECTVTCAVHSSKNTAPALYTGLLLSGKLNKHLNEIDEAATAQMELLTKQMATAQGITEELKARDQMAWIGAMENIRNVAEEVVLNELVYT